MDPNQVSTSAITPIQSILFPVDRDAEWMKCFKYDSAEWTGRLQTYMKPQPMNKLKAAE
jgi:hypothetical protein